MEVQENNQVRIEGGLQRKVIVPHPKLLKNLWLKGIANLSVKKIVNIFI